MIRGWPNRLEGLYLSTVCNTRIPMGLLDPLWPLIHFSQYWRGSKQESNIYEQSTSLSSVQPGFQSHCGCSDLSENNLTPQWTMIFGFFQLEEPFHENEAAYVKATHTWAGVTWRPIICNGQPCSKLTWKVKLNCDQFGLVMGIFVGNTGNSVWTVAIILSYFVAHGRALGP